MPPFSDVVADVRRVAVDVKACMYFRLSSAAPMDSKDDTDRFADVERDGHGARVAAAVIWRRCCDGFVG